MKLEIHFHHPYVPKINVPLEWSWSSFIIIIIEDHPDILKLGRIISSPRSPSLMASAHNTPQLHVVDTECHHIYSYRAFYCRLLHQLPKYHIAKGRRYVSLVSTHAQDTCTHALAQLQAHLLSLDYLAIKRIVNIPQELKCCIGRLSTEFL